MVTNPRIEPGLRAYLCTPLCHTSLRSQPDGVLRNLTRRVPPTEATARKQPRCLLGESLVNAGGRPDMTRCKRMEKNITTIFGSLHRNGHHPGERRHRGRGTRLYPPRPPAVVARGGTAEQRPNPGTPPIILQDVTQTRRSRHHGLNHEPRSAAITTSKHSPVHGTTPSRGALQCSARHSRLGSTLNQPRVFRAHAPK